LHVVQDKNPLEVWRALSRTGRHGWRRGYTRPVAANRRSAMLLDWLLLMTVASVVMILHITFFHFSSSLALHTVGLSVWFGIGGAYIIALYLHHGRDYSVTWVTGYLLELINMMENVFIFHSITKSMRTPREHARKALYIVMVSQIIFQTVCFMGLDAQLRRLKFLPYILGVWLIYMGYLVSFSDEELPQCEMLDTRLAQWLQRCIGRRFCAVYDEAGNVFAIKDGELVLSMLGPVVCLLIFLDGLLEIDVTLTKIEEISDHHISHTSSVVASFALPDLFFVAAEVFRRVSMLKYCIGAVTAFFGVQMLASELVVVPAAVSCLVMVSAVLLCLAATALLPVSGSSANGNPAANGADTDAHSAADEHAAVLRSGN